MFVGRIRQQAIGSRDVPSTSSGPYEHPSPPGSASSGQEPDQSLAEAHAEERTGRPNSRGRGPSSVILPPLDAPSDAGPERTSPLAGSNPDTGAGRRSPPPLAAVRLRSSPLRQASFRNPASTMDVLAPTKFSRVQRDPGTRATAAQLRAIFKVPHEPLPLESVSGGGAFGTVYRVKIPTGFVAVKQVRS